MHTREARRAATLTLLFTAFLVLMVGLAAIPAVDDDGEPVASSDTPASAEVLGVTEEPGVGERPRGVDGFVEDSNEVPAWVWLGGGAFLIVTSIMLWGATHGRNAPARF